MPFTAPLLEIDLEPEEVVLPLLREVRRLADLKEPPKRTDGCYDCQRLEDLVRFAKMKSDLPSDD